MKYSSITQRVLLGLMTLSVLSASSLRADTSVWKAERDNSTVYLGGTIHMLKPGDLPLPAAYDQAYSASQTVFFETDLGAMQTPRGQAMMATVTRAQPGSQLVDVLSANTYQRLTDAARQRGLDSAVINTLTPGMALMTLQTMDLMRMGMSPEGVDFLYYQRAGRDNKKRAYLETLDQQLSYIGNLGKGWEEDFVLLALRDLDRAGDMMDAMIAAWRKGDLEAMDELFLEDMHRDYPDAYQNLIVRRNNDWLPQILALFDRPGTEFVLVGVAHFPGDDGLIEQMRRRGFKVTQVQTNE